jgi:hypothetical protein
MVRVADGVPAVLIRQRVHGGMCTTAQTTRESHATAAFGVGDRGALQPLQPPPVWMLVGANVAGHLTPMPNGFPAGERVRSCPAWPAP